MATGEIAAEVERYLDIDWSREPESERERKIREVLLHRQLRRVGESPAEAMFGLRRLAGAGVKAFATDMRAALDIVDNALHERRRANQRREVEDAIRELDRER